MKNEINKLKEAFVQASTDKEHEAIEVQMQKLIDKDPDAFAQGMVDSAKDTAEKATELAMRQKLQDIIPAVSLVYIAKTYFNKTDAWLYQRINGNTVNGKPAKFTPDEIDKLKYALDDLSKKIGSVSISL
ncbi:DUF5053 domain-containing protein [Dysgonomonas sp. 521]|uniref:DUF5053 domain-containing protein n=1 Tax=Dysgonomonas sp. 521 TaxID=2302932 RepID=UPI0013D2AE55|nr:DUF5053 domain-containing protein [Dysgonomonas sp. 521]NDV95297.1 DUF5053 domain-containing protein [Dysgonomonas sp. 521]